MLLAGAALDFVWQDGLDGAVLLWVLRKSSHTSDSFGAAALIWSSRLELGTSSLDNANSPCISYTTALPVWRMRVCKRCELEAVVLGSDCHWIGLAGECEHTRIHTCAYGRCAQWPSSALVSFAPQRA